MKRARRMMSRYMFIVCSSYSIHIVYLQLIYGHEGKAIYH